MSELAFNIAAVERETGLSKDVLRMWERRYGFPVPERDAHGDRMYPVEQVDRLRLIRRLMDLGHRPGKLVGASVEALNALGPRRTPTIAAALPRPAADLDELVEAIRRHDAQAFLQSLQQRLARQGLLAFVQDTIAPLTEQIGVAWEDGRLEVFEEHLFTELTKRQLRQAIGALPAGAPPRVLLTTLPGEPHQLGLLMVEALFALEGADCVPLGTQMPLADIGKAAVAHRADVVGLSFSANFPSRLVAGQLRQLRALLPAHVALWAGGQGVMRLTLPDGVRRLTSLSDATAALADWRGTGTDSAG